MNSRGASSPSVGVLPPDQRLVAVGHTRCERDDRLIVEHELVAVDRVAELGDPSKANERGLVERRVEERKPEAGMRLRPVHRGVCFLQ